MTVNIKHYQEAYEGVLNKLINNSQVIAVIVYGSMVTGDIWEKSDIDLLVISKEKGKADHIYSKALNIPIHIYYISKDNFIDSIKNILKGGSFHKAFFSGKLVYCTDSEIEDIHMSTKFYNDREKELRNIEILSNLLNSLHYTNKYYYTRKIETAYQWSMEVLINYARLIMNMEGHITDKDILSFAVTVNYDVEFLFNKIIQDISLNKKIQDIMDTVESFVDVNITSISTLIIEILKRSKHSMTIEELKNSEELRTINADISYILYKLSSKGIIKEGQKYYMTASKENLINEVVYYLD